MQDAFSSVIGQARAVDELRAHARRPVHAYLFVGPAGAGKLDAAYAFAATLIGSVEEPDPRALHRTHPDVTLVERQGASISVDQAREISRTASRSPNEARCKVLILNEFHLVEEAAPALLKTIEEASSTTVFVVLAESITADLVTIASRCVHVQFSAVDPVLIAEQLVREGVPGERAQEAAAGARGSLSRARVLAHDDAVVARRELWRSSLSRLDGTGHMQWKLAADIVEALDHATAPLVDLQNQQSAQDKQREKDFGIKSSPASVVEAAFKRERRRLRTDEMRNGFAVLREEVGKGFADVRDPRTAQRVRQRLAALSWAETALQYNPGDVLLLHGLFTRLDVAV